MPAKRTVLPPDLAAARARVDKWRSRGRTRRRIPEHVWELAVGLVPTHGVHRVSRALRLRYDKLKSQVEARRADEVMRPQPAFVELAVPAAPVMSGAHLEQTVELTDRSGRQMTIRTSAAVDAARLVATFCESTS